jgi:hypothetical protein
MSERPRPLFRLEVSVPTAPKVIYMKARPKGKGHERFDDITLAVTHLEVYPLDDEADDEAYIPHLLCRLDKDGKLLWETRHPSLQETFWYAEWEYGIPEQRWAEAALLPLDDQEDEDGSDAPNAADAAVDSQAETRKEPPTADVDTEADTVREDLSA